MTRNREPKKHPRQARSRATVDYILEAAAQILSKDGAARLTTNRIARKAGVAIASIYQYFPNKEAIVQAVVDMQLSQEHAQLERQSASLEGAPLFDGIRAAVQAIIDVHAHKPQLVTAVLESVPLLGGATAHQQARRRVVDLVAETMRRRQGELRPGSDPELRAFVVVHAVEAVIHDAAAERPELLADPAFAEELADMVQRFLL
jgi:AcrR family transcriptional regulator